MKIRALMMMAVVGTVALATSYAADTASLDGVKCLINPKAAAKAEQGADWKDGKVYFCCPNCKGKFEKMTKEEKEKMAASSNAQLVATKQYEQKTCPVSGQKLNADIAVDVAGVKVSFCCNNCKGKVEGLKDEEKLTEVFGEKPFKNFAKKDSKK